MNDKSYRKNVGLIVLRSKNQLLICRRKGKKLGNSLKEELMLESLRGQAAYRELFEEVGIRKNHVSIIKRKSLVSL